MILLVTYDLKGRPEGYEEFFEALKKQGRWSHYLTSTWLISTEKSASELYDSIKSHLNIQASGGDTILVTDIGPNQGGWLPRAMWEWIRRNQNPALVEEKAS